ncbi:MAG: alpha-(1-_3)-arabinofuranosyltransferase family protein, partial [Acidimicrobiales bacterium]
MRLGSHRLLDLPSVLRRRPAASGPGAGCTTGRWTMTTTITTTATPAAPAAPAPPTVTGPPPGPGRLRQAARRHPLGITGTLEHLVLAGLAFVPLLVVRPGIVTSDTKTYLYLDPGRFLSQVAFMWNPTVALGTVTHEYIGYLVPMGPFYWLTSVLHIPLWVSQRLWLGGILFAAGAGILFLCKVLDLRGPGRLVAALAFMLSPYFLQYAGRISVLLLPWAGLPWMIAFIALALRRGGWRWPALFALVVVFVGSVNASSIIYVGVAPVLWLAYAVLAEHDATWRRAGLTMVKVGLLTVLCSLWWIVGLQIEGAFGVDVLKYTETVPSTSQTSNASEVIRGLGYWYFYGGDRLGPWTNSAVIYTQQLWLIALSFLVPALAFLAAVFVRWRHRAYFVLLVVVGLALSVGAHPFDSPTPLGGALKQFMTDTTAGLAMRSTDRATPLVVIGLAMLLGIGVTALWRRAPWTGLVTAGVVAGLVIANNPAMFNGDAEVSSFFTQPASLPAYQTQAIAHLNTTHPGTRVLAIPGNDFAADRWGDTVDTPQAAFLDRPFVTREQQIMGSMATADTLYAMDDPIQEGIEDWNALAPMARLLSAGDVMVEYDQAYEHYGVPQPDDLARQLQTTPTGLSDRRSFGKPVPNVSAISTLNEEDLASPADSASPAPLNTYTVDDPRPVTRAESNTGAVIVAGDATGLQAMAGAGLLDTDSAIYYSGTLDPKPSQLRRLMAGGAGLVVTDTNRKQAFRWDTLTANYGATETPDSDPAKTDLSDSPIDLFSGAPSDARATAAYIGAADVTASSYGNSISYTPEDRAYNAIDNNEDTAWRTGTFVANPSGQWWQVRFTEPVTTGTVTLVQPVNGDVSRWITRATLTFDGGSPVTVDLGPSSRTSGGQVISFPQRAFHTLRITVDATSDDTAPPAAAAAVGLAEVEIPGQKVVEVVQMPQDLLRLAGPASQANRLTLVMTRQRVSPYPPRSDPETTISRAFTLPSARTFTISGLASISALVPDDEIDRLVGRPGSAGTGIVAFSKGRMPGDLDAGAAAALDGDPATAWQPGWGAAAQQGEWLQYDLPKPITFDHLNLQVVADGRHSVPTAITISTEQGSRSLALPPIADSRAPGATVTVPLNFPALSGDQVRLTVTGVRPEYTTNYYAEAPIALPLGIAEVGIPNVVIPPVPAKVPVACRSNLLAIDGHPVSVEITGSTRTALDNGDLSVKGCGPDANGIALAAGPHILQSVPGHDAANPKASQGWNLDQVVLDSAPGGGPAPVEPSGQLPATQPGPAPSVTVTHQGTVTQAMTVTGATAPFELVLGQSVNAGWRAVATPGPGAPAGARPVDLGPSQLVDGFANGWPVSAAQLATLGRDFTVEMTWTPQSEVWAALAISALAVACCLALAVLPRRWLAVVGIRRRRRPVATRERQLDHGRIEP